MVFAFCMTAAIAACSDWPNGLPVEIAFGNWTSTPITIVREKRGGGETVAAERIEPEDVGRISTNESDVSCSPGTYIARDESGIEIARQATDWCSSWVVATAPIPVSITNGTRSTVEVVYRGFEEQVLSESLAPGATLTGSVDQFGDPSKLCLGGDLVARSETLEDVRVHVFSCKDWLWVVPSPTPTSLKATPRPTHAQPH
jgi:hypothetical protein